MLKTLLLLQSNLLSVALYIGLSRASPLYIYIGAEKNPQSILSREAICCRTWFLARAAARPWADSRAISSSDFRLTFFFCRTSRSMRCSSFAISRNSLSSLRTSLSFATKACTSNSCSLVKADVADTAVDASEMSLFVSHSCAPLAPFFAGLSASAFFFESSTLLACLSAHAACFLSYSACFFSDSASRASLSALLWAFSASFFSRISALVNSRVKGNLQSLAIWPTRPHREHFISAESDAEKMDTGGGADLASFGCSAAFSFVGTLNLESRAAKRFMWIIAMLNTRKVKGVKRG